MLKKIKISTTHNNINRIWKNLYMATGKEENVSMTAMFVKGKQSACCQFNQKGLCLLCCVKSSHYCTSCLSMKLGICSNVQINPTSTVNGASLP